MNHEVDILIKHARLRGKPESLFDIGIARGKIISLEENPDGNAKTIIDAQENLVTESFVNPHLHLCIVYTLQMMDEEALIA
jgi:cytosine deaminase